MAANFGEMFSTTAKAILSILLISAFGGSARSQEIVEKPDPALGITTFTPKKIRTVGVNQGLLKMDRITWRVYPVVYQQLDKAEKQAVMTVEIIGPMNGGFTNAPLVVNIDGRVSTIQIHNWMNRSTVVGNADVSALIVLRDATFRQIATAREIDLTVLVPGTTERYTVRLNAESVAVFAMMLSKYDELDPKKPAEIAK